MLALALGGRSIAEWQATMTTPEFLTWQEFYRLYPFDDRHRFHRPAAMVASAWGGDLEARLDWLQPTPPDPSLSRFSDVDLSLMQRFGVAPPARSEPADE